MSICAKNIILLWCECIDIEYDHMKSEKTFNIKFINILIACTISLFVVFPDIVMLNAPPIRSSERTPIYGMEQERRPPAMRNNNDPYHPPAFHTTDKIITNYIFFFVLSIILLFFDTYSFFHNNPNLDKRSVLFISIGGSLLICILFTILYPLVSRRPNVSVFDGMNVFKVFFIGLVSFLFVYVMHLINQQQKMILENERLKSENLLAQYNTLVGQINPHFFFNSLNSLSALIREEKNGKSLKYINELSDIFRYVLKSNKQWLTSLKEELDFLQAYRYMMEIRYENKLHFTIEIDRKYLTYQIPSLSTQLVLENVIKHNEISNENPLTVHIYSTPDNNLVISNPIREKNTMAGNSGMGLQNLDNRYQLLVHKRIVVENDGKIFTVRLPLTNPENN